MVDEAARVMCQRGYEVWAKFSSVPMYHARLRRPWWRLMNVHRHTKLLLGGNMLRTGGFRLDVKTFSFRFDPAKYEALRLHG